MMFSTFEYQCSILQTKVSFIWSRVPETTLQTSRALAEVSCSLPCKIQPTVYKRTANPSRGGETTRVGCLATAGRVTPASGTTFLYINTLARLTGTALGVARVGGKGGRVT